MKINVLWLRRDLRLTDNRALIGVMKQPFPVIPLFIFDTSITDELDRDDPRISFIYETLAGINKELKRSGSSLYVVKGEPLQIWKKLSGEFDLNAVYINKDYEPYATDRDNKIEQFLNKNDIKLCRFRDQVIFEENEILKADNKPYTIFTPYKKIWLKKLEETNFLRINTEKTGPVKFHKFNHRFPSLEELGFIQSAIKVKPFNLSVISEYHKYRDYPAADRTSYLSPHLRFGTVSIRDVARNTLAENEVFLSELIWREFFMQILYHFPHIVTENFKPVYNDIQWRNDEKEFRKWCNGETGYPIVDAGMRQLNDTGYMHNRVRMIAAGFLCKHLLTDWRWGEAYFAQKLLDFELSSNNGNWQWAAGTGCDAAPYFRVFNPESQQKKFDPENEYVRRWVTDLEKPGYPKIMVDHQFARDRAISAYRNGLRKNLYK